MVVVERERAKVGGEEGYPVHISKWGRLGGCSFKICKQKGERFVSLSDSLTHTHIHTLNSERDCTMALKLISMFY